MRSINCDSQSVKLISAERVLDPSLSWLACQQSSKATLGITILIVFLLAIIIVVIISKATLAITILIVLLLNIIIIISTAIKYIYRVSQKKLSLVEIGCGKYNSNIGEKSSRSFDKSR